MNRRHFVGLLAAGSAHTWMSRALAQGVEPMKLTLGTATPGGGFPVYGDAVITALRDVDPTLTIEPRNTKGSTENVPLLEKGELDLGLVQGEVAYEALQGIGRAPSPIRIVAAMYSKPGMFVVRGESPARTIPASSVARVRQVVRIATWPVGSTAWAAFSSTFTNTCSRSCRSP